MTRAIRSLNHGRLRIWAIHHGQEAKNAAYLVAIVAIYLAVSSSDYRDQVAQAEADRDNVAEQLRAERAAKRLPRVAWVIESSDPGVQMSLAEIAGALDVERAKMRGAK